MKRYVMITAGVIGLFLLGMWTQHYWQKRAHEDQATIRQATDAKPLYWVSPMNPSYRRDKPGKSPMGMALVPVYAQSANDNSAVHISPAVEQNLGVQTAIVIKQTLSRRIDTVGYVKPDEDQIEHVHTYTDGWVKRLLTKRTGEHVKKGQLLFQLYSPIVVNAQEEYLLALKSGSDELLDASRRKLLTLGVSEGQIAKLKKSKQSMQLIDVFAKQSGIISELLIREGMYVKPDKEIMTLEDLSHIWVIGEVFERQSQWVAKGQPATAEFSYLPGKLWQGKVDYVYPRLDKVTHTLKIRLRFDNPRELLKPNMYASITVFAAPEKNLLVIPRAAVIYSGQGAHVIMSLGQGRYAARTVTLGIESGDKIAVLSGLKPGERVVTAAQFLIDSESNLKASFLRMNKGDA